MNIFFENLNTVLREKNISGNKLCTDIGIANANYSNWKKGIPKAEIIIKIADYFNISTDYLLGRAAADPELPEDEKKLLENYRKASEEGKRIIQKTAEGAADQDPQINAETA